MVRTGSFEKRMNEAARIVTYEEALPLPQWLLMPELSLEGEPARFL
jgi:hypothetical protein